MTQQATSYRRGLQDAFRQFNELLTHLSDFYRELGKRATDVMAELAAARGERLRQLVE